jgi:ethanolaminephosphotransferase
MVGFYLSTAEEYYTGVLYLGYVNGPTEGIIVTCVAFLWTWLYGKGKRCIKKSLSLTLFFFE